jgi:ribonuclease HII
LRTLLRRDHHGGMSRTAAKSVPRLPLDEEVVRPTFRRERSALKRGVWPVAGCDEAGRGPLAGPVVAAAVILNPYDVPRGLDDSKRLTAERREVLYERICARAQVAVAMAPPWRIDRDNILRASLWALARAVVALPVKPRLVFVDGRDRIDAGCDCEAVIGGDALVASIAAASIVAKVTRDRLMARMAEAHPGYGFERHMGYSVPEHFKALDRLGPTIHHRRSFSPVAIALGLTEADPDEAPPAILPL